MRLLPLITVLAVGMVGPVRHASASPEIFNLNGTFADYSQYDIPGGGLLQQGSLTGNLNVDNDLMTILSGDLSVVLPDLNLHFTGAPSSRGQDPNSSTPDDETHTPTAYFARFTDGGAVLNLEFYDQVVGDGDNLQLAFQAFDGESLVNVDTSTIPPSELTFEADNKFSDYVVYDAIITQIPEPSSLALLGTGAAGAFAVARRRCVRLKPCGGVVDGSRTLKL